LRLSKDEIVFQMVFQFGLLEVSRCD